VQCVGESFTEGILLCSELQVNRPGGSGCCVVWRVTGLRLLRGKWPIGRAKRDVGTIHGPGRGMSGQPAQVFAASGRIRRKQLTLPKPGSRLCGRLRAREGSVWTPGSHEETGG